MLSGLILFHFPVRFHNVGISVTDAWGSTIYTAHLYNALRNEELLQRRWNGMDVAQILLREESFYVGGWPQNKEGYLREFCLRLGMDVASFKKPIQGQRRSNGFGSGAEGPKIKDRIPVSSKFKSRYAGEAERVDWIIEQIDAICSLSEYQQVGSGEEDILQFHSIPDAEELRRKREQHRRKPISADSLRPESLLRELMFSLQNESLELQFSYLLLHRLCWQLLGQVKEHCDALLCERYGSRYIERENQLTFLVGYILEAAVGIDNELMKAAADSMNEMNGFFDAADQQLGLGLDSDMISNSGGFITDEDGTVGRSSTSVHAETNVAIWSPTHPTAFDKIPKATIFTRLGTMHSHQEVKAALISLKV